ncbi:hypothetical protein SY88_00815 [Clostridiales bacterium PH28_bin88]|nr:hypothetical protein SY88_00815 [Clostridiales bacterium PH28_bin88]
MRWLMKGRRYDVGDRLGFLQAAVEFALKREDFRQRFREYPEGLVRRLPPLSTKKCKRLILHL